MFGRKNKPAAEQGSGRRPVRQQGGAPGPAFSYYASRSAPVNRDRNRAEAPQPAKPAADRGATPVKSRLRRAQLPVWLLVVVIVICGVKVLLLSTSPKVILFGQNATTATYAQTNSVYAAAAGKVLAGSITGHTKLTADLNGTARTLEQQFPELQTVSIGMPLIGNRPVVYAQLAQPSLILQTARGNYALNADGVVLARLQTIPGSVALVVDQSGAQPSPGKQYLPHSTVSFIGTVAFQLSAAHIPVSSFVLPQGSPYELDIHPGGQSYAIRYNLEADALQQSGAAIATLTQLGAATPATYLDVRVPGRVYFK